MLARAGGSGYTTAYYPGGSGGGGQGYGNGLGTAGTANTGGGGGGSYGTNAGAAGGTGVVVISYVPAGAACCWANANAPVLAPPAGYSLRSAVQSPAWTACATGFWNKLGVCTACTAACPVAGMFQVACSAFADLACFATVAQFNFATSAFAPDVSNVVAGAPAPTAASAAPGGAVSYDSAAGHCQAPPCVQQTASGSNYGESRRAARRG